jgi:hypothetical protein
MNNVCDNDSTLLYTQRHYFSWKLPKLTSPSLNARFGSIQQYQEITNPVSNNGKAFSRTNLLQQLYLALTAVVAPVGRWVWSTCLLRKC